MSRGVRLAGGTWRGRRLQVASGVRPTEGRVREALMSIWQERLPGARILDLFTGSGAVGLEALGRGALSATLVDRAPASLTAVKSNCRLLEAKDARVLRLDLPRGLQRLTGPFDLIFADPPYDFGAYTELIEAARRVLAVNGELVVEHEAALDPELPVLETRRYGGTVLSFFGAAEPS